MGEGGGGREALYWRGGGGGGAREALYSPPPPTHPPGRVEPDISSLWMDLFSLDSVIFVIDFSDTYLMTNAENSVLELPNFKIFWGRIPPYPLTRLLPLALEIMSPPYYKESSYGPGRSSQ